MPLPAQPKTEIWPVPEPSCRSSVTTKAPPLIVMSPVKVLLVFVKSNVPSPIFVSPPTPAMMESSVARLPEETETVGVA